MPMPTHDELLAVIEAAQAKATPSFADPDEAKRITIYLEAAMPLFAPTAVAPPAVGPTEPFSPGLTVTLQPTTEEHQQRAEEIMREIRELARDMEAAEAATS